MENNIRNQIHVEFYGLPGCGKSTISHLVSNKLQKMGYIVYEPSYTLDHLNKPLARKLKKIIATVIYYFINPLNYNRIKMLVKDNGYISKKEYLSQIVNIIPKKLVYEKSKSCIYLWDEGLIQSSISLSYNNDINVEDNVKLLVGKSRILKIYLKLDVEKALERMLERKTNDSRVEKEPNINTKRLMMNKYLQACDDLEATAILPAYLDEDTLSDEIINIIFLGV
jgi:hypothetical protein